MKRRVVLLASTGLAGGSLAAPASAPTAVRRVVPPGVAVPSSTTGLEETVAARERAFARTMAQRDLAAFGGFVSLEAVFLNGHAALVGRAAVVQRWAKLFDGPDAPFDWWPDTVAVLASGRLALTSGPVFDPDGTTGSRFQSTWRREDDGEWRVVFDSGYPTRAC